MSLTQEAQNPQQRLQAALADAQEGFEADLATFRAPADDGDAAPDSAPAAPVAPPSERPAQDAADPASGATRSDTDEADEPVTLTRKELAARIEKETTRQRNDQSRTAIALKEANDRLVEIQRERDELRMERQRIALERQAEADVIRAGQQPDREDIRRWATDQVEKAERESRDTTAQQQQAQQAEANTRSGFASIGYEQTKTHIALAAAKQGITLDVPEIEAIIAEGYADPDVQTDIADWKDPRIPTERSKARIESAYRRIQRMATEKVAERAAASIEKERPALPKFNRAAVHGEPHGNPTPLRGLSFAERKALVMAEAAEQFEKETQQTG